jgi:hypothetical protein
MKEGAKTRYLFGAFFACVVTLLSFFALSWASIPQVQPVAPLEIQDSVGY